MEQLIADLIIWLKEYGVIIFIVGGPIYISRKFKNFADKQDVPKLTKKLEEIKNEFINKNQHLDHQLNVTKNALGEINKLELDIIFKVLDLTSDFYMLIKSIEINRFSVSKQSAKSLKDKYILINDKIALSDDIFFRAFLRLHVYFNKDSEILTSSEKIFKQLLLSKFKVCSYLNSLMNRIDEIYDINSNNKSDYAMYLYVVNDFEYNRLKNELNKVGSECSSEINTLTYEYTDAIKKYLDSFRINNNT